MKIKIGDLVVCEDSNVHIPELNGKIGRVLTYRPSNPCGFCYNVDFGDGYRIWCKVRLVTKLDKLLLGVDNVEAI